MKTKLHCLFFLLALFTGVHQAAAQGVRFFRISGPVTTTITTLGVDGSITWTNAATNTIFIVQTSQSLVSQSNWVDYIQVPVTDMATTVRLYDPNPPTGMALIPAGMFTMGDTLDGLSDAIPTNVTVSAFYMDVNLVSYSQWQSVQAWAMTNGYGFGGAGKAANHPVVRVDWYDTVKWSNARSQQAGLTPVYYTDAGLTEVYTNGEVDPVYANWTAGGYRLPTEAEWEKAARGGLSGQRFPWGNTISESQANYFGNTSYSYDLGPNGYNAAFATGGYPYTSPVGYFAANSYGLCDMAGNVWEWCWDWYGTPYAGGTDPRGPVGPTSESWWRVIRGCSWDDYGRFAWCAVRGVSTVNLAFSVIGFRCVRGL